MPHPPDRFARSAAGVGASPSEEEEGRESNITLKIETTMTKKINHGKAKCIKSQPGHTKEGEIYEFIDNGNHGVAILGARYSCSQNRFKEQFEIIKPT